MKVMCRVLVLLALAGGITGSAGAGPGRITPANVGGLVEKWTFPVRLAVTAAPVVGDGVVYATSWTGTIYALDPDTGVARWSYAAGAGVQSTPVLTPAGTLCFGDSIARVHCVDRATGTLRWRTDVAEPPFPDQIWSGLGHGGGRLFAGVASYTDDPCTRGKLVALDLATGERLWKVQTVPDMICTTDTAIACTTDADCAGGSCIIARGAGVTAQSVTDADGRFVYMNTVGCYTFPSVGDSDSVFKIDAATGAVMWKHRVDPPEQFGSCENASSIDCGTDAMCEAVGGRCDLPKDAYHDFGFLNGPILIDADDGAGGTRTLVVSGSKNGTLYAFDDADGKIVWSTAVLPKPVSPGFAGFGLFNGAITHADGRIFAALGSMVPGRVCDNDHLRGCNDSIPCPTGGTCLAVPDHLMAFDARDGSMLWSADDIGPSWAHVAVENGIVYTGAGTLAGGPKAVYAYDSASGRLLATLPMPSQALARPAIAGDSVYVGYGIIVGGGVRAFTLCGNGVRDDGEECDDRGESAACDADCTAPACGDEVLNRSAGEACDAGGVDPTCDPDCTPVACGDGFLNAIAGETCEDGNSAGGDCCSASCVVEAAGATCGDEGDRCTADRCDGAGMCVHVVADLVCAVAAIADAEPCAAETLPKSLTEALSGKTTRARGLVEKAVELAARGKTTKVEKLRRKAASQLDSIAKKADKLGAKRQISEACRAEVAALVGSGKALIAGFRF